VAQSFTFHSNTNNCQLSINHTKTNPIRDQIILFFDSVTSSSFQADNIIFIADIIIINIATVKIADSMNNTIHQFIV